MASAASAAYYIITALAAAVSAGSAYRQGQYAEAVGEANAQADRQTAQTLKDKAEFDVQQHRRDVSKLKSSQTTSLLKSGVTLSGSALELLADTSVQARVDEDIIRYNTESGSSALETRARMSEAEGAQGKRAGEVGAVSSLLSSTGKFSKTKAGKKLFKT